MQVRRGGIKQEATNCKQCSKPFRPANVMAVYCSKQCKRIAWLAANPDKHNQHLLTQRVKQAAKAAEEKLLRPLHRGICLGCKQQFTSSRKRQYCSDACHPKAVHVSIMKESQLCRCCGLSYKPVSTGGGPGKFCSETCRALIKTAAKRVEKAKRKARLKGVTVERVDPFVVFDRDKWKCQLCGIKTPKSKRGSYDDNAPELDHIKPLGKGGEHSYINTQCSCRRCNRVKSDSMLGQLLMFG